MKPFYVLLRRLWKKVQLKIALKKIFIEKVAIKHYKKIEHTNMYWSVHKNAKGQQKRNFTKKNFFMNFMLGCPFFPYSM